MHPYSGGTWNQLRQVSPEPTPPKGPGGDVAGQRLDRLNRQVFGSTGQAYP